MVEGLHDKIKRERDDHFPAKEAKKVDLYRRYSEGMQDGTLSTEQRQILKGICGHDHADNVCDTVLATGASRTQFEGFEVPDAEVQTFLDDLTVRNGLPEMQYDVHYATERDGNHAVLTSWRSDASPLVLDGDVESPSAAGRVVISHEPWWNGSDGVFVQYESDGRTPEYAVKDWEAWVTNVTPPRKIWRRIVWFPDHIERYIKEGEGWKPYRLETDPQNGPILWEKRNGDPLGVPIIHFPNGRFGKSPYGMSDLAGGIIGLQDDINDFQRDISAAGRLTAYQMFWVTGHNAEEKPLRVGPGALVWSENADAAFGNFPAGSLAELTSGLMTKVETVARDSGTPVHLITGGDWPSGEALIRAESPLVDRANRTIRSVRPSWQTVGHRSTEIFNAFGQGTLDESKLLKAKFTDPERRDALTLAQVDVQKLSAYVLMRELGWSIRAIQELWGLDSTAIEKMRTERKQEIIDAGGTESFGQPPRQQPPA